MGSLLDTLARIQAQQDLMNKKKNNQDEDQDQEDEKAAARKRLQQRATNGGGFLDMLFPGVGEGMKKRGQ